MRTLLIFCLLFSSFQGLFAQSVKDVAELRESEFDFGAIPQGKPVFHFFEVKNTSGLPLKIENVSATCGCTTPEWNREPIAAGATGKIRVGYNAASEGHFEKAITISYGNGSVQQIKIKGMVWKAPAGPAPTNASVNFLKQQIQ